MGVEFHRFSGNTSEAKFLHLKYFFNPGFSDISVIAILSIWRERLHCVM